MPAQASKPKLLPTENKGLSKQRNKEGQDSESKSSEGNDQSWHFSEAEDAKEALASLRSKPIVIGSSNSDKGALKARSSKKLPDIVHRQEIPEDYEEDKISSNRVSHHSQMSLNSQPSQHSNHSSKQSKQSKYS